MPRRKLTSSRKRVVRKKSTRAKATRSKSTTSKPKKKVVSTSANNAHHQVRMMPFSSATSQPKIPDGLFTSSLSRRCQNVVGIRNGAGTLGTEDMYIIMGPTLGVPLLIYNSADGVSKRGLSGSDPQFVGFPGQTVGWSFNNVGTSTKVYPILAGTAYDLTHNGGFSQWRIVSQGLRLELTNTDDENDGWFEACRFNFGNGTGDIQFTPLDGTTTGTELGASPGHVGLITLATTMAMIEQPGYKTGLLRDLKKYEFMLHPQSTTHDPVSIDPVINVQEGVEVARDTNAVTVRPDPTLLEANRIKDSLYDKNMDWMLIRLHCRDTSLGGSGFICNVIQNLEVAFNPDSDFAAFQTINKLDKKHQQITDAINNSTDAWTARRE